MLGTRRFKRLTARTWRSNSLESPDGPVGGDSVFADLSGTGHVEIADPWPEDGAFGRVFEVLKGMQLVMEIARAADPRRDVG